MLRLVTVASLVALLAAPLAANAQQGNASGPSRSGATQSGGKVESNLQLPAERLIGRRVHSIAGNDLGRIEDVVVTPDGNVKAVIAAGGDLATLGADRKRVAIDWDKIQFSGGPSRELVANVPLSELKAAPDWLQENAGSSATQPQTGASGSGASRDSGAGGTGAPAQK